MHFSCPIDIMSLDAYARARTLIDEAHKRDPLYCESQSKDLNQTSSQTDGGEGGGREQDEMAYADAVESWAMRLISMHSGQEDELLACIPSSSSREAKLELVRLGARCQHLERFLTPRSSYPEGKAGYLRWRRDLYGIQADRAKELLVQAGVAAEEAECVRRWVSKTDLKPGKAEGDRGTQLLEDAAVVVFLEDQLDHFAGKHPGYTREKFVDILRKTWRKLSPLGKEAAAGLDMGEDLSPLIAEATKGQAGEPEA